MEHTEKRYVLAALVLFFVLTGAFAGSLVVFPSEYSHFTLPIRVACVGDSITELTNYPADLQTLLGNGFAVGNFGASGRTVLFSADKPYIYSEAFMKALVFKPDIVVIMLGTNDANPKYYPQIENFSVDYKMIIARFEVNKPLIWLVLPPPIFNDSIGPNSANLVAGVIPRIVQLAAQLALPTINVYSPLINQSQDFSDGLHPNAAGSEIIANAVYQAISK